MTTQKQYDVFYRAYNQFNKALFGGELPEVMITLHRKKNAYGYFWGGVWADKNGQKVTDEIAINPETIRGRDDKETLSTLVHEMVHLWQHHHGDAPKRAYHNQQWADKMEQVGLMPSTTGQPGGKRTGPTCSHYIIDGGAFDMAASKFLKRNKLTWGATTVESVARKKAKAASNKSKTKYTCGGCGLNAWAKPGALIGCWECDEQLTEA